MINNDQEFLNQLDETKSSSCFWEIDGLPVGQPVLVNYVHVEDNSGNPLPQGTITFGTTHITNGNKTIWIGDPSYTGSPPTWIPMPTITPNTGSTTYPSGGGIYPSGGEPTLVDKDEKGNRIVRAPMPSLELVLVEIAKVLKEGGDILQIREIFERYKLKLVDHDGETVFDPRDGEKLENKGL